MQILGAGHKHLVHVMFSLEERIKLVLLEITNFLLQRYLERLKPICHPQGAPQNGCLFADPNSALSALNCRVAAP